MMRKPQVIRASSFGRHSHRHPYAALVLSGSYEEAGDQGRFQVVAGDVVLHEAFEAHLNRFSPSGAVVLNLPLPSRLFCRAGHLKLANPDKVMRAAEKDLCEAVHIVSSSVECLVSELSDWPQLLASDLLLNPNLRLGGWAADHGLSPWTLSRGFVQTFSITPEAYRARVRTRRALKAIQTTTDTLVTIACQHGFSDQTHMTRSVKELTGQGPGFWRSANGFKTRGSRPTRNEG